MPVQGITMPAPYGGLDLTSPIDNTEPFRALDLINIMPDASAPFLRKGYQQFVNTQPLYSGVGADGSVTQEFMSIEVLEEDLQTTTAIQESADGGSGIDGAVESAMGIYS